jgi:PmbA protein
VSEHELLQLAEKVAAEARSGEQVEAYVARGRRTDARAYGGEVESLSQAESAGIGVRVVAGRRQGFAYAGTLEPDAIAEVLAEARDNATFGTDDEHLGLAEPDGAVPADLDLFRPELAEVPTEAKVDLALELERRVKARDPRIKGVRVSMYGDGIGEAAVVTSTGIRAHSRSSRCYLSVQALAVEGDETQIGSGVSVGRTLADLDIDEAAADAADRATRLLGSRKAPSQKLTIVLDPDVTSAFLGIIGGTLNGEAVLKGRSLFANRVGEQVAAPALTFVDDPTNPESLAADAYDDEGLASRRNVLVDGGVLQGYLHNTYSGRRAGTPSTASAVRGYSSTPAVGARALAVRPGTLSQEELLAEVGEGLLVQGVNGLHSGVNPVSGDFSVGATGIMFRRGELAEPVREITIASTLQRMLLDIVAVGGDLDWTPGGTGSVSLAIRDVAVSGS